MDFNGTPSFVRNYDYINIQNYTCHLIELIMIAVKNKVYRRKIRYRAEKVWRVRS